MASLFQHPRGALVISTEAESYLINTLSVHPTIAPVALKPILKRTQRARPSLGHIMDLLAGR